LTLNNFLPGNEEPQILDGFKNYAQDNANRLYELNQKENLSEYAQNVGRIHRIAPGMAPGLLVALAKSNADDVTIAKMYQASLALEAKKAEEARVAAEKQRGWFNRNIWQKTVTATKWGIATANLPLEFMNTVLPSALFTPKSDPSSEGIIDFDFKNPFRKGWFASTDFGTLLMEDEKAGRGFMVGGDAAINKEQRLLDYAGAVPLTVEAGALEDTAAEVPYEEIRAFATQLLANGTSATDEEAMFTAEHYLRAQKKMPFSAAGILPLALPRIDPRTGAPLGGFKFDWEDVGSTEYNLTSTLFTLALALGLPEPVSKAFKGAKNLTVYARSAGYASKAGDFVIPVENIAQTAAEANLMSRIDAINLVAQQSDMAGIAATDAAVETLSVQPGVWWHGSRSGPIPGNNFVSIIDPLYPTPEGNLVGPGLYLTEAPIVGSSYAAVNKLGTSELSFEELDLLQEAVPQDISGLSLRAGIPVDELPEGANPATLYRFTEGFGSDPVLIEPFEGLATQLPEETIQRLADDVFGAKQETGLFGQIEPDLDGFRVLEQSTTVGNINNILAYDGISAAHARQAGVRAEPQYLFDNEISSALQPNLQFPVNARTITERINKQVRRFFLANDRFPESVDEFRAFLGDDAYAGLVDTPVSMANGDAITEMSGRDVFVEKSTEITPMYSRVQQKIRELANPFSAEYGDNLEAANLLQETVRYLSNIDNTGYLESPYMFLSRSMFDQLPVAEAPASVRMIMEDLAPRLREVVGRRISNASGKLTDEEITNLGRMATGELSDLGSWEQFLFGNKGRWSRIFDPNARASWMKINAWLLDNGIDGYAHQGGGRTGGGMYMHKVKVMFDPLKHFDVTDPLTGEKIVLNEALAKMIEADGHGAAAAAAREEAERLAAMREAGIIDGYGPTVDPAQFATVFTKSAGGRRAVDRIWELSRSYDKAIHAADSAERSMAWYKLWKQFDGKLPLNVLDDIVEAGSREEVVAVLNKHVGWTPGLTGMKDVNLPLTNVFSKMRANSRIDNLMTGISDTIRPLVGRSPRSKTLDVFGSEAQQIKALQDLDSFLSTGVRGEAKATALRAEILSNFAAAMRSGDKAKMFEASKQVATAISTRILQETGDATQAAHAADVWQIKFDEASGSGLYQIGKTGTRIDNNYAMELYDNGSITMHNMVHGGPGLLSELQRTPLELPDVQELRRMTSWLGVLTGKQGIQRAIKGSETGSAIARRMGLDLTEKELAKLGEFRLPLRAVDFLMTGVWKNFKKLSIGYGLRNTMEAQARLAFSDLDNLYAHPLNHILIATYQKLPDDIALGEAFNPEGWRGLGRAHAEAGEGFRDALGAAFYGSEQRIDMMKSLFRNGEIVVFSKDIPRKWAAAGGYELRQLFNDVVARKFANGDDLDAVMKWLYSEAPDAKKALNQIENLMKNGERFYDPTGASEVLPVAFTPENVRIRVQTQQQERLMLKTGGDPLLMEVAGRGTINGKPAFKPNGQPSRELVSHLESQVTNPTLPEFYKGRATSTVNAANVDSMFKQAMSLFFDGFMGRAHNTLDRSPLWRQLYTQEINRLAPLLSPEAAAEIKTTILERVEYYNGVAKASKFKTKFTLKDYLGNTVDPDELMAALDNAAGWASRDDIHILANATTLDKIEGLLFDASARNSITDAARIVSPFGAAFAEVMKSWIKLIAVNPEKVNSLARGFGILSGQFQPDALRNNGIMHQDPVTGDWMYSLPASGAIFNLLNKLPGIGGEQTGSQYQLEAPVKGLNMAFNAVPGFSPIVGFPLGKLLYGKASTRDIAAFLLPYGQPKSPFDTKEYLPGWASKIVSALMDNPRMPGVFGDTVAEVARVELATGKWGDISNPETRQQFFDDVEGKARILAFMRGFGQFIGPASPQITAKIQTQFGSVMSGYLTAEFHRLQDENYDTAVEKFMDAFGPETFAFMAGKTRAVYSGVESSREFAKWELDNADLFDSAFKEVAGFFGPKGSNFDWAAYQNQVNSGKKEWVPPVPDQIEIAEKIVGYSLYRQLVDVTGPPQTAKQREILTNYRLELEKKYPGMVTQGKLDVNEFNNKMKQLRLAVDDPRLQDNDTAIALKSYLDLRDTLMVVAKSSGVGWESDLAAPLRAGLLYEGTQIVKETPEFARVFDSLLINEVNK